MRRSGRQVNPARGEVWVAELDPTVGHEQAGTRPVLVVSDDRFNQSLAGRVIVAPLTTTHRGVASHVPVLPPEGGIRRSSVILCEAVRSISKLCLEERWGIVSRATLKEVEDRLRLLFSL